MARYYPVSPLFWTDKKVLDWDEAERNLALYLLTSEHRNLEGLYRMPLAYIQADLRWSPEQVEGCMGRMVSDGFVEYDDAAQVVFLPKALRYHTPTTDRQIQGAVNVLQRVPDSYLWGPFLEAAAAFAPALYKAIAPLELAADHREDIAA